MSGRVTIQDIADALGLSRNTVSKAINNTGILADATREKVLQKAMEMGYKTFSYAAGQVNNRSALPHSLLSTAAADGPRNGRLCLQTTGSTALRCRGSCPRTSANGSDSL